MSLPTDDEIMTFNPGDADLPNARRWIADQRWQARAAFIDASNAVADATTPPIAGEHAQQQAMNLAAAKQRKENARARYGFWLERVASLPPETQ